jgi:hypothetical protein
MAVEFYQVWHNHDLENRGDLISPFAKYLAIEDFEYPVTKKGWDIQEYRIWQLPDEMFQGPSEFIGFASARWSEKFPGSPNVNWILNNHLAVPPSGRTFQTFITAQHHWLEHTAHFHVGLMKYIMEAATLLNLNGNALNIPSLPMCNSFITRKDVFFEIKQRMNFLFNHFEQQYGHEFDFCDNGYGDRVLGCFYERMLMLSTASIPELGYTQPLMAWQWHPNVPVRLTTTKGIDLLTGQPPVEMPENSQQNPQP